MTTVADEERLRIGVLAQRTGTTTHVLRVWEERYGLLEPARSPSGYRLYRADDEQRVREMLALRAQGVSAAEAAALVVQRSLPGDPLSVLLRELLTALTEYDDHAAHRVVDRALAGHEVEDVVEELFFPVLRYLGDAWEKGAITVAQEHYASTVIRNRMQAMVADLGRTSVVRPGAPVAVLACTAHERHDIGLLALDLALRRQGWQVAFLGADTPVLDALSLAEHRGADVLVLCGTEPHMFAAQLEQQGAALAARRPGLALLLGGRAATVELAQGLDAGLLELDHRTAARQIVALAD